MKQSTAAQKSKLTIALIALIAFVLIPVVTRAQQIDPGTPPMVTVTASPSILWPPNHKLVPVTVSFTSPDPLVDCIILGVAANEPIVEPGPGVKKPDFVRTGELTVSLRAEHSGNSNRVYSVIVLCSDGFGNTTRTNVPVIVPHDQGKNK
jgi:hypothetical protein